MRDHKRSQVVDSVKTVSGLLGKDSLLPGRWGLGCMCGKPGEGSRVRASERKKAPPPTPTLARVGVGGGARCVREQHGADTRALRHAVVSESVCVVRGHCNSWGGGEMSRKDVSPRTSRTWPHVADPAGFLIHTYKTLRVSL